MKKNNLKIQNKVFLDVKTQPCFVMGKDNSNSKCRREFSDLTMSNNIFLDVKTQPCFVMKKIMVSLVIGLLITIISVVYTDSVMADLSENLVRLHIIANSDSEIDQNIKYKVRDAVIEEAKINPDLSMDEIQQIANTTLAKNGFSYGAKAEYGTFRFPTKVYDNITLPQGIYSGVRILLGDGVGQNWWCVMYPPLCFTQEVTGTLDTNGQNQLAQTLEEESYNMITNKDDVSVEMKFKVVEIVQNIIKR